MDGTVPSSRNHGHKTHTTPRTGLSQVVLCGQLWHREAAAVTILPLLQLIYCSAISDAVVLLTSSWSPSSWVE